jgi:cell division protein FtsB
MQQKIQNLIEKIPLKSLQDSRSLGLVIFAGIVLLVTWSGIGAIETNYGLQKQVNELTQTNKLQNLTNENLALQNQYYNTNEYVELQARELLGKGDPGETLILVSKSAALNQIVPMKQSAVISSSTTKPKYQQDFESWMTFYFHRSN